MHYLNPFRVFDIPEYKIKAGLNSQDIAQIAGQVRQKLSQYADGEMVHFKTHKIEKARVLDLVKELESDELRAHHLHILQNKSLLNFLEYGHLGYLEQERYKESFDSQEFKDFVEPYLAWQYSESLLDALKARDKKVLAMLSTTDLSIKQHYKDNCYQPSANYMGETLRELQDLRQEQALSFMSEREILSHLPDTTIEIYNMLPDYFRTSRNQIATEVHGLAIQLNNDLGRGDGAEAMVRQALKLKMDQGLKEALEDLLVQHKIGFKMPLWLLLGIGAIVVLFLIQYIEQAFFGS